MGNIYPEYSQYIRNDRDVLLASAKIMLDLVQYSVQVKLSISINQLKTIHVGLRVFL